MPTAANTVAIPLKEFDQEMQTTRNMLERLPDGKAKFKPHEKSMEFGYLSQLVASIPNWIEQTLATESIDLGKQGRMGETATKELLEMFDKNVAGARAALQKVTGEQLDVTWSLVMGEQTLMSTARGEAVRNHLSHLIHHRGQLSVYERLLDVKLPQIYGPTADTKWGEA
ncbi:MAG: DinB family protein [Gemmatimonas sp.]